MSKPQSHYWGEEIKRNEGTMRKEKRSLWMHLKTVT